MTHSSGMPATDETDESLVARMIRHGDERAFDVLYDRHAPAMYLFALRVCGGREADAQDAVQDAWLRATDRWADFAWRSGLRTWLIGIVLNVGREVLRRRSRRRGLLRSAPATGARATRVSAGRAATVSLERALQALPETWRLVVLLHDVEGNTHEEVGRLLDIPAGTSRSRLHRGRRELRRLLSATEPRTLETDR